MSEVPPPQRRRIAVRAYGDAGTRSTASRTGGNAPLGPSPRALVFDTETDTDAAQQLRIAPYQVRTEGRLREIGFAYDPVSLSPDKVSTLQNYCQRHRYRVRQLDDFIDRIFFPLVYRLNARCIGFNLPFDLARLAIAHAPARRGRMRGGFSLKLHVDDRFPRIQIKHLNSRAALIQLAGVRRNPKQGQGTTRRGHFLDCRTVAGALLGGSWSLQSLARHLGTEHQKLDMEVHGGPLTQEYLDYAMADVQVTWECYEKLQALYDSYGLGTKLTKIYSEASLGKAYLKAMGIVPWREAQPDVPPELLGIIMSTYYGGRAEVHIRRKIVRVLYCDFLSMYPTVCTLLQLWPFVIATGMTWREATEETQAFLETVMLQDLQRPETWPRLRVLAQIQPDADILPVRTHYNESQRTIGVNTLTTDEPMWYTLADVVASKLLTGQTPSVLRAIRFEPMVPQDGLRPVRIAGNPDYSIDPNADDFFKRLIELRQEVKDRRKAAEAAGDDALAAQLDAEQEAIKVCANATSYGIYMELNVTDPPDPQEVLVYGPSGESFSTYLSHVEEPGAFFHPLLGTLITGAARLMLAITERLTKDVGIDWALCDTDSMALAQPAGMANDQFLAGGRAVIGWFRALNPYARKGDLLKIEDQNYRVVDGAITGELHPLYCYAISAKRYALFNLDEDRTPILRKVSAHGLGHLVAPYQEPGAPASIPPPVVLLRTLGVERWQYDVWYRIVQAAVGSTPERVRLDDLAGYRKPATSRYGATTPALVRWFDGFNGEKPYREQVRPFGFLYCFQARQPLDGRVLRPVAPYDRDGLTAADHCFDRSSGAPIDRRLLRTYAEALAQYQVHPEAKFLNGEAYDTGHTRRRHVRADGTDHIGKEADKWEEQYFLGLDPDAQIDYGLAPEVMLRLRQDVLAQCRARGVRNVARRAGLSVTTLINLLQGRSKGKLDTIERLRNACEALAADEQQRREVLEHIRERVREIGVRELARQAGIDPANLAHVIAEKRGLGRTMAGKLERVLVQDD